MPEIEKKNKKKTSSTLLAYYCKTLNNNRMAIVQNPIIGTASGSVGGVTFSTLKGQKIMRTKPTSVANPNTLPQRITRSNLTVRGNASKQLAAAIAGYRKTTNQVRSIYSDITSMLSQAPCLIAGAAGQSEIMSADAGSVISAAGIRILNVTTISTLPTFDFQANVTTQTDDLNFKSAIIITGYKFEDGVMKKTTELLSVSETPNTGGITTYETTFQTPYDVFEGAQFVYFAMVAGIKKNLSKIDNVQMYAGCFEANP